jgi:flagella basal body P-ring formation protein FlgA
MVSHFWNINIIFTLTLFFFVLSSVPAIEGECHLFLKNSVRLPSGLLSLDKLGTLECQSEEDKDSVEKKLQQISLGKLFPSSRELVFKKEYIETKWNQFFRDTNLHISGFSEVSVSPEIETLEENSLETKFKEVILNSIHDAQDYKIEFISYPRYLNVPESGYKIEYDTSRVTRGVLAGKLIVNGRVQQSFYVQYKLLVKRTVFVANQNISRNLPLNPSHFRIIEQYVDASSSPFPVEQLPDLHNYIPRKPLQSGDILDMSTLYFREIIGNRQKLMAIFENGVIRVKMPVISMERGRKNDVIQVKSTVTDKIFRAKVLDEGTVIIQY